jgi:hypothetical protein
MTYLPRGKKKKGGGGYGICGAEGAEAYITPAFDVSAVRFNSAILVWVSVSRLALCATSPELCTSASRRVSSTHPT